ncbi:MAG: hypothetical protein ACYTBW_05125 [Planctomycetota bacterium]
MDDVGWLILSFCILIPLSLFFGLNTLALRSFSRLKLQDAFRKAEKESLIDEFLSNAELLTIVCGAGNLSVPEVDVVCSKTLAGIFSAS